MESTSVTIIGAGLAGSEAAFQLAKRGHTVDLYEMRPQKMTEAHTTSDCAELVCSNSFGSDVLHSSSRMLKDELKILGCFLLQLARKCQVPAGASLAIDRNIFSKAVTEIVERAERIRFHREELTEIPEKGIVILATGPLTSPALSRSLMEYVGKESLFFYDAISPIVSAESLNLDKMFFASRYDKGEPDFLNIPLSQEQYEQFVAELLKADVVLPHDFEEGKYFESCLPIEVIASRGLKTLAFGPMKPVGLDDPSTGRRAHAVIQLRAENKYRTAYNLVGFQTKLKYKEQERIFRTLPGLENAEFLRLGSLHRNTYVQSPQLLLPTLQLRKDARIFLAGQITGTEGYLESSATGYLAGLNASLVLEGAQPIVLPEETMLGSLMRKITDESQKQFQPTNVNFGLLPPLAENIRDKKLRNQAYSERAIQALNSFLSEKESLLHLVNQEQTHLS